MRHVALIFALTLVVPSVPSSQTPPRALPLGEGRPETPGITRTTLRDDAKVTVTRVSFTPGAAEPVHTHPYDVVLVPVIAGPVDWMVADRKSNNLAAGEVQFVGKDVPHQLRYTGRERFELIAIAIK